MTDQSRPPRARGATISDRRYREMMEAGLNVLEQGVTVFDADLRMVAWNEPFMRLLDFPPELGRAGTPFEAFIRHNAERGEYGPGDVDQQVAERVAAARNFRVHQTARRRPDGRLLSIHGAPLPHRGFITVYSDVTAQHALQDEIERHNRELEAYVRHRTAQLTEANAELTTAIENNRRITAALQRSEARLREITDAIPAHIAYFDDTWTYRYANKPYARWFGFEPEAVVGCHIADVAPAEVFERVRDSLAQALDGEPVTYEYTMTVAGERLHARSTLVPDVDANGAVIGCYVHAVDITESCRTQQALAQAQKMEAIGQLSGGLAHDFNNMLTVVLGNLAALREARPDDAGLDDFLAPAVQAAEGGAELVKRLLAFARQQPLVPRPVEVNELILGMARLIRRSLPESIRLATTSHGAELVAMIDPHQLESALLNLALNARDAMPAGGELRIEAVPETLDARAAADLEVPPGDYVRITVTDTGTGMDGSTLARVFDPFFTTKGAGAGSGLGLAMVYGFTRQSGGGVRIRSRQACGTAVALLLPRTRQRPADTAATPQDPRRQSRRGRQSLSGRLALLVEDDADVRKVVRKQLAALGCSVLEAESGAEAADMVENIPAIGLVLSDIVMPGSMDGRALARFTRRFRPDIPVILMSGDVDGARSMGRELAIPLLPKPFSRDALSALLDTLELSP